MASAWIDDDDLSSLGWRIADTKGLDDGVLQSVPIASLPGVGHAIIATSNYAAAPRPFSMTFLLPKTSTLSTVETALHVLKDKLAAKTVAVRHLRRSNQKLLAVNTSFPTDPGIGPQYAAPYFVSVVLGFLAPNPFWVDTDAAAYTVAGVGAIAFTTATATPTGTAPCWAVATITNTTGSTITNPHILIKNSAATTVVDLPTTCSILAGDAIEIDGVLQRVRKRVSGVWTVDMTLVASGFPYPRVSNADGLYGTAAWPTIQTDLGTGALSYTRSWA